MKRFLCESNQGSVVHLSLLEVIQAQAMLGRWLSLPPCHALSTKTDSIEAIVQSLGETT